MDVTDPLVYLGERTGRDAVIAADQCGRLAVATQGIVVVIDGFRPIPRLEQAGDRVGGLSGLGVVMDEASTGLCPGSSSSSRTRATCAWRERLLPRTAARALPREQRMREAVVETRFLQQGCGESLVH